MSSSWVTLDQFSNTAETHLAKSVLEREGIPCLLQDEHMGGYFSLGAPKLRVPAAQVEKALRILNRPDSSGKVFPFQ